MCYPDRSKVEWRDLLFLRLASEQIFRLTATYFRLTALAPTQTPDSSSESPASPVPIPAHSRFPSLTQTKLRPSHPTRSNARPESAKYAREQTAPPSLHQEP